MRQIIIKIDKNNKEELKGFYRMDALAENLKKHRELIFLCNEKDTRGINYLKQKGYVVKEYNGTNLANILSKYRGDNIIVNINDKSDNLDELYSKIFNQVVYVDDRAKRAFKADMIISPVYEGNSLNYLVPYTCQIVGGEDALLIREEARRLHQIEIKKIAQNILVVLGETNKNEITKKLLEKAKNTDSKFKVILANNIRDRKLIMDKITSPNIEYYNEEDFLDIAPKCDIAVLGYNYFMYEAMSLGIPTIGVVLDRQDILAGTQLLKYRIIRGIGVVGIVEVNEIIRNIELLQFDETSRKEMQTIMSNVTKTNSNITVANRILTLI